MTVYIAHRSQLGTGDAKFCQVLAYSAKSRACLHLDRCPLSLRYHNATTLYWIITYAGVVIFVGLTAWDTQKIRRTFEEHGTADDNGNKLALFGALILYLDFINLFLFLLRIFGGNRD